MATLGLARANEAKLFGHASFPGFVFNPHSGARIAEGDFDLADRRLSEPLLKVLARALSREAQDRFRNASEMRQALEDAMRHRPAGRGGAGAAARERPKPRALVAAASR